jgi:hypothetical protein
MNADALTYRRQRGLDRMDEQMALLVQRVSGAYHRSYFFPLMAGVGLSHNPYVWKKGMDANAGMLRLVLGLGTRAVNRVENDYPRIVALDDPLVKPLAGLRDIQKYSQHYVDHLNLEANELQTIALHDLDCAELGIDMDAIAVRNPETARFQRPGQGAPQEHWVLTFDRFLTATPFVATMSRMLKTLQDAYDTPVDIEFTVNVAQSDDLQVNVLQCRPFQTIGAGADVTIPDAIAADNLLISIEGNFMGGNVAQQIDWIIRVDPGQYAALGTSDKYSVARLIGRLNRWVADRRQRPTLLIGPGRWGTHTPAMGVPVTFSEINHIVAMAEVSYQDGSLIPDLSFGTHFFHDLTETHIVYMAIYPESADVVFNPHLLETLPNALAEISPADSRWEPVVKVCDLRGRPMMLRANVITQKLVCCRQE